MPDRDDEYLHLFPKHRRRRGAGHCCFAGCAILPCGCCSRSFHDCGVTDLPSPPPKHMATAEEPDG